MLRLARVGRGGEAYYLQVAAGTGTGIEPAGQWVGHVASQLGLAGPVEADPLSEVLAGRDATGTRTLSATHDRVRVVAFDLTFCAPKSVSLLHALGEPEVGAAVRSAHEGAVSAAFDYVERRVAAVRRPLDGHRVPMAVDGLIGAGFLHRTSRALDPHLHTHVVVANVAVADGWPGQALDGRGFYAHRQAADALYHAELRAELTSRLGVAWLPPERGRADVAGIAPQLRQAFSKRSAEIAADLARSGASGRRAADLAATVTRPSRRTDIGADELVDQWRRRALDLGLGPRALDRVCDARPRSAPGLDPEAAERAAASLHRAGRPVARRDAVTAVCWTASAGVSSVAVGTCADRALALATGQAEVPARQWGPGVAERRLALAPALERSPTVELSRAERRRQADELLHRQLAARGMTVPDLRGWDRGPDLGLG